MSERRETFGVGERPRIEVSLTSGSLRVVDGEHGAVEIIARGGDTDRLTIDRRGDSVIVQSERGRWLSLGSYEVTIAVPPGTTVEAKLTAVDVFCDADVDELRVGVTSGDVRAGTVDGDCVIKTASGDVSCGDVGGRLEVSTASGDTRVRSIAGEVEVNCAAGDVAIGSIQGRTQIRTASGDIRVDSFAGDSCDCKSMAGDVRLGIPAGRTVDVDLYSLSGEVKSEFDVGEGGPGPASLIRVKTVSGDVLLSRAG